MAAFRDMGNARTDNLMGLRVVNGFAVELDFSCARAQKP